MKPHYLSQSNDVRDRQYTFSTFEIHDVATSIYWNDFSVIVW